jgi:hypothetical protein
MTDISKCKGIYEPMCGKCIRFTAPTQAHQYWIMIPVDAGGGFCQMSCYIKKGTQNKWLNTTH